MNFPSRATRRDTGWQSDVDVVWTSNSCGMEVADEDALVEGGRGPESVALTARHKLPLSGISDYTSNASENHLRRPPRPGRVADLLHSSARWADSRALTSSQCLNTSR